MGSFLSRKKNTKYSNLSVKRLEALKNIACPLPEASFKGFANYIKVCQPNKILILSGGGMTDNGWISDIRSTLDHLQETDIPYCHALFDYNFFCRQREPLYGVLDRFLNFPSEPNIAHVFVRLLHDKGVLLRHYTENMDDLDLLAGLPEESLVQANGSYYNWSCAGCRQAYPEVWFLAKRSMREMPDCLKCGGIVKPDVVFYDQPTPRKFFSNLQSDLKACDLMIVLGSSLSVTPFAYLPEMIRKFVPRLFAHSSPISFHVAKRNNDIFYLGSPEDCCLELVKRLGWTNDLVRLIHELR